MKFTNLEKAPDYEVEQWLINSIPELTAYQKEYIKREEIVRFSNLTFMKYTKKIENPFIRLTVVFIPIVVVILLLGLPINFLFTGSWGYNSLKFQKLYNTWTTSCGL